MKRVAFSIMCCLGIPAFAAADVPRLIQYQGKLLTSSGTALTGSVSLRIRLYDHPSNLTPVLFDETHAVVALNRGLFSILVGSQTGGGIPDPALDASAVYMGVAVNGAAELSPRRRIASNPYTVKARSAEQLVRPGTMSTALSVDSTGRFGMGTETPDASAFVDMSSSTGGLLPPRMTGAQRDAIATPAPGLMVYNSDTNCLDMWTGSTWKQACFDCTFTPPITGNNGPICEGSTLNLTATTVPAATYAWIGPNGFSSSDQNPSIPNATPAASGPYSVTATADGCTSNPVSTLATVNPTPTSPAIGNSGPICVGQTLMLTSTPASGATYAWTGPDGFSSNLQNPTIPNATVAAGGAYTLTVSVNGCEALPVQTSAVVNAIPATPGAISGSPTACVNSVDNVYSIVDVPGATSFNWTVPAGATITNGQGTAFITVTFGTNSGNITVTASNSCGTSSPQIMAVTLQGGPGSQTFSFTGGQQTFVVPNCITTVTVQTWGAQGANNGGLGGYATALLPITPGETLYVYVGGRNGFNGGGAPWNTGGVGGGGSDVRQGGSAIADRVIVAGGGGGGDTQENQPGGAGGGGSCGTDGDQNYCGGAGGIGWNGYNGAAGGLNGGAQTACSGHGGAGAGGGFLSGGGGACGNYNGNCRAESGTLGQGGAACTSNGYTIDCGPGGGGGGYYGGGGGASGECGDGGGGGGSSWTGALANQSFTAGTRPGDGQVVISW